MKKILLSTLAIIMSIFVFTTPVFADSCTCKDGNTGTPIKTIFFKNICECKGGESILSIVNLVIDILSVSVGILGVIGISVVGIQYLTAGGNEEKTRKAKRRMVEIVLGIVIYIMLYWILKWLNLRS